MTKALYKLTEDYRTLEGMLDNEDFRPDDIRSMMNNVKGEMSDKVESIGKLILSLRSDVETIKSEEERLRNRRVAVINHMEWLENYLLVEMSAVGLQKVKREVLTVSIVQSPPTVEIIDIGEIPDEFGKTIPAEFKPDKKAILDHFKSTGEIVYGVNIDTSKKHIVIR